MQIGIFYNGAQVSENIVAEIAARLRSAGATAVVFGAQDEIVCDRLLVLGGDGTMLRAAKRAVLHDIPLVGINYGRLGFLTEFERGEEAALIELILDPGCPVIERAMIRVRLGNSEHICLNELALLREISPERSNRVERIAVSLDGKAAGNFVADGLIVATPTGSTAYSLSAGGSILAPDCGALILTPVCAFSMSSRPIVCSDSVMLGLTIAENDALMAYGDGEFLGRVTEADTLTVTKARSVRFLTRDRSGFFLKLTQKLC